MMHLAMHDALNTVVRQYDPYSAALDIDGSASPQAAIAAAARDVLISELPTQAAAIDAQYIASLSAIPDGDAK